MINDKQLLEGIIASIFFPITLYYFRHLRPDLLLIMSMIAWFVTWLLRKASNNIYDELQKKYKWRNKMYSLHI